MTISIKGKEYGFQWGMGAIEIYMDTMGYTVVAEALDVLVMPNKDQNRAVVVIFLAAIQNWCELNNV